MRVIIAGTFPPPYGGQNINTKRVYDLLASVPGLEVGYWRFSFSPDLTSMRRRDWRKAIRLVATIGRLIKLRRQGQIDWIIYPSGGPHLAPAIRDVLLIPLAAVFCTRLVVQFRAAGVAEGMPRMPFILRHALVRGYRRVHCAISLTRYGVKDTLALGVKRVQIVPNAIEDLNPTEEVATGASLDFLYIGHLCRDKGIDALIPAFAAIHRKHPSARLRLVGEVLPPFSEQELAGLLDREGVANVVAIEGKKDSQEALQCYRTSQVVIFSSVAPYESFGMVLIEAMMHGRVLVVSDWRANAEVVTSEFGGVLYLPSPGHVDALASALEACIKHRKEWDKWGRTNREIFKQHYTIPKLLENWQRILA